MLERVCHQYDIPPLVLFFFLFCRDMETGGEFVILTGIIIYQVTSGSKGVATFQTDFQGACNEFRNAEIAGNRFSFLEWQESVGIAVQMK
jgi:hypothetical protein